MPAITIRHRRPKMRLIELRDIRKTYIVGEIEVHALQGVSLDIDHGEYRGPDGAPPARERPR